MLFRIFHRQTGTDALSEKREMLDGIPLPFKTYPRFPQHSLPSPQAPQTEFSKLLASRSSRRDFDASTSIPLQQVSNVLHAACGLNEGRARSTLPFRHHPSGGALYPLECYLAVFRVDGLASAVYHYAPQTHALEELLTATPPSSITDAVGDLVSSRDPAVALVLTSVWGRNYPKYGEFAYRLSLIESGHLMQDILLAAEAEHIKAFPLSGFRDEAVRTALDLGPDAEDPLYMAYLGK